MFGRSWLAGHRRRPTVRGRLRVEHLEDRRTPANNTVAGALSFPFPTINNVSVEWLITGDDDLDATVAVRYRRQGDTAWSTGLDLRRIPAGSNEGFTWANKFAGSVFDVAANTTYEVQLALTDPDGGSETRTGTVTTRAVPAPMAGAPVRNATPATLGSILSSAQPGDVIELGAGTYTAFTVSRNGLPGQPIIIRDSNGDAVLNGPGGAGNAIDLTNRSHAIIDGLTINSGRVKLNNTNTVAVIRCTVNASADGIIALTRSENLYIADNRLTGPGRWIESDLGASGFNGGEGIEVIGPGHVIEHNYVKGFRDLISLREGVAGSDQRSIDILDNDLYVGTDDGIEADFSEGNVRVMRNRITNCFMGVSSQPSLGGPTYFIRNAMYNVILHAFKLNRGSVGDVALHNTVVKNGDAFSVYSGVTHSRGYFRNNLFLGGPGGVYNTYDNGPGRVADLAYADATNSFNFDAYGSTGGTFAGRIGSVNFSSLSQMRATTTETSALQVNLGVFNASVAYPSSPLAAELAPPDLRLRAGSATENAGQVLGNINDGFAGAAPDIGAFEIGAAIPAYGPRAATASPPQVTAFRVNDGSAQRSRVTSLAVTFSAPVALGPGAFVLTPQGGGASVALSVATALVNGVTVATLTFPGAVGGSLADGNWVLRTVAAEVRGSTGAAMAGDRTDVFYRLFGDANGDRGVDALDFFHFRGTFGLTAGQSGFRPEFDANGDGLVDNLDFLNLRQRFGQTLPA